MRATWWKLATGRGRGCARYRVGLLRRDDNAQRLQEERIDSEGTRVLSWGVRVEEEGGPGLGRAWTPAWGPSHYSRAREKVKTTRRERVAALLPLLLSLLFLLSPSLLLLTTGRTWRALRTPRFAGGARERSYRFRTSGSHASGHDHVFKADVVAAPLPLSSQPSQTPPQASYDRPARPLATHCMSYRRL